MKDEVIWLTDLRCWGFLVARYAYHSIVRYTDSLGIDNEVEVMNEDYELWEERAIDFESE